MKSFTKALKNQNNNIIHIDYDTVIERRINLFAFVCGVLTAFIGLLVLCSWYFGISNIFSLGKNFISMANVTGLMFLILGSSITLINKSRYNLKFHYLVYINAIIIMAVALLSLLDHATNFKYNLGNVFGNSRILFGLVPDNRMSFMTAICFIFSSISLLLAIKKSSKISILFGSLCFLIGFIIVQGYFYGVPYFYDGRTIPVALPTAILFIISSLGLIIANGKDTFPLRYFLGDSTRAKLMRTMLPAILLLEFIRDLAETLSLKNIDSTYALTNSIYDILAIIFSGIIITILSRSIGKLIDKNIEERKQAEKSQLILLEQLKESNKIIQYNLNQQNLLVEELSAAKDKLEVINSEKDKFFSIIAHDLRAPFNGFLGLTKIMAENITDFTLKEMQDMSHSMQKSAKNLFNLLENLLEWARMQRGVTEFKPEICSLDLLVKQIIDLSLEPAKQKNIRILNNIPVDCQIIADAPMLNSILRNLFSNAIKFTPKGGFVEIGITIKKSSDDWQSSDDYIIIYIKDSGIGMNSDTISKLFLIDQNVSSPGTENEPSSGLGLILCKEFVDMHGGKIWAESEEDKGSTFYFTVKYSV